MAAKLPVTVVTGFLGAGKTSLIRNLLRNREGRRIAVLVNEFGEVGIDGELLRDCGVCPEAEVSDTIVELANGCLCCTVQEEFLPTMQELLKRRDQLDAIVIETSGLALPKPLVQAFRWPEIRTGATVDGVITLVDCEALARGEVVGDLDALEAQRQADDSLDHETPIEELFEDQLACADLVLLTKVDRVEDSERQRVETWLSRELPSGVKVVPCRTDAVTPDLLLGFSAAVEDNLDQRPSHHDHEEEHDHDEEIRSLALSSEREFDPAQLETLLKPLVAAQEIYRVKGFVAVPGKPMRLVFHGVGNRFDWFFDRPWRADEARQTRLVVIGAALDEVVLQAAIA